MPTKTKPTPKGRSTQVASTTKIRELEKELLALDLERKNLKAKQAALKEDLKKELEAMHMNRTMHYRIQRTRSGGVLDAHAIARHFGCSVNFLSRFRRGYRTTYGIQKAKPPVNPELINGE
ncbi:hypothetical protein [Vibrio phage V-YDF132]|nr:hypothetical protein [Vibrio phage V-YDF132]